MIQTRFACAAVAVMLLCLPLVPRGATADVYAVEGLQVDVTAETAARARAKALAQGEAAAFRQLLERLTLSEDHEYLPVLKRSEIAPYLLDFSVADEKTSAVRYLASLTYRFDRDRVRMLLTDQGLLFAETPSKPLLVLPVIEGTARSAEGGTAAATDSPMQLWDDPNPWRDAWGRLPGDRGLVPVLLPDGDLDDIAALSAEQAVDGDIARLAAIGERYGAGAVLVVYGVLRGGEADGGDAARLEVYVTRYGAVEPSDTQTLDFAETGEEGVDGLLLRAASAIAATVEDDWKRNNVVQSGAPSILAVNVPIQTLADWIRLRDALGRVAIVRKVDMVLLSRANVRVNLRYQGQPDQLTVALEQADLSLYPEGDQWLLVPRGTARADDS